MEAWSVGWPHAGDASHLLYRPDPSSNCDASSNDKRGSTHDVHTQTTANSWSPLSAESDVSTINRAPIQLWFPLPGHLAGLRHTSLQLHNGVAVHHDRFGAA